MRSATSPRCYGVACAAFAFATCGLEAAGTSTASAVATSTPAAVASAAPSASASATPAAPAASDATEAGSPTAATSEASAPASAVPTTSAAPLPSSTVTSAPKAYPLFVAPAGFLDTTVKDTHARAGSSDRSWAMSRGASIDGIELTVDPMQAPEFMTGSHDLENYGASLAGMSANVVSRTLANGDLPICHGTQTGYFIRTRERYGSRYDLDYIVIALKKNKLYQAKYSHDASAASLPAAVAAVTALCPP